MKNPNFPDILTGFRPTSTLTIANYLGVIKQIVDLQDSNKIFIFVADLHALTDNEPKNFRDFILPMVASFIALGLDPAKVTVFLQSDIKSEIFTFTSYLSRLITVAELLRVPTLKDKLKNPNHPERANALLLLYPVMMAADIILQQAKKIPVGEDQLPHLELTREFVKRLNKKYGCSLILPQPLIFKTARILSLRGLSKMSKSNPEGAIFITDDPKTIYKKIMKAETAIEGKMTPNFESLILIVKNLAGEEDKKEIDELVKKHLKGEKVIKIFKEKAVNILNKFLQPVQAKLDELNKNPEEIQTILKHGAEVAKTNAEVTLDIIERSMNLL